MERSETIPVARAPVIARATVCADSTPLFRQSNARRFQTATYHCPDLQPLRTCSGRLNGFAMWAWNAFSVGLPAQARDGVLLTGEPRRSRIVSDGKNRFCLGAQAVHSGWWRWVSSAKELPLGVIRTGSHYDGPFQEGRSCGISPGCLDRAPVGCLVPPEPGRQTCAARYRPGAAIALCRKPPWPPTASAARGPPSAVRKSYVA